MFFANPMYLWALLGLAVPVGRGQNHQSRQHSQPQRI